jgi:adenosylcobyric acid synthase
LPVTRAGGLLIAGTASDAGKSVVVAGICRWLARRGVRVAPFKAQNMALNSAVTQDGAEIGRAQVAQAAAAGVPAEAAMNPILLKPSGERHSQVVVLGRALADVDARSYRELRLTLREVVLDSLAELRRRYDVVVCEGAGSPAEINLRDGDLVNMGLARAAGLPVVLVGDIDRGGVFASLFGTLALLGAEDQALVAGMLINKFRGDRAVLDPGLEQLRSLTGRPVLGVLPWLRGLWLDVEDSLALEAPREGVLPPLGRDPLTVAVVRPRWISNFTDYDALAAEPGVVVRFTQSPADVLAADLAVLPGTKATVADLAWLRERGLDRSLATRAARRQPTLGICGGYQMLGKRVIDPVESGAGEVEGLGLLPVETVFEPEKVLGNPAGHACGFGGVPVAGYEIHHGRVRRFGGEPLLASAHGEEGCRSGAVLGLSWHGVFEGDAFRRAFLGWVAERRGLEWVPGDRSFAAVRAERLDQLGDLIAEHADTSALERLIEQGAPPGLAFVPPGGPGGSRARPGPGHQRAAQSRALAPRSTGGPGRPGGPGGGPP